MQPVLILGAGINGAALARELAWQGLPVVVVDAADVARGATPHSSRLIHGGLRYLEYGEFGLVAESLAERGRLVALAPHHVRPLRLLIPIARRAGGLMAGALRFLRLDALARRFAGPRGLWVVRLGLWLYDLLARDRHWPRHTVHRASDAELPRYAPGVGRWCCAYFDAQIALPERFVVALLDDAREAARQFGERFDLYTYTRVELQGGQATLLDSAGNAFESFEPAAIVNATGAWVDRTLAQLQVEAHRFIGGTKGSHLVIDRPLLRDWLGEDGVYAEASDGRPVFVLPWGESVLVGTTDLPFAGDPADATATDAEIEYLLSAVNRLLPHDKVHRNDVLGHYCGVRPLPAAGADSPAAITRRHWLEEHVDAPLPMYSLIGGKLTTCRSLAESTCDTILRRLGLPRRHSTRAEVFSGSRGYPADLATLQTQQRCLAEQFGIDVAAVGAVWRLFGTRASHVLAAAEHYADNTPVTGTNLPRGVVRWVIDHEWVERLADLVERRLVLHFDRRLTRRTLVELAELLSLHGKIRAGEATSDANREAEELARRHGRKVD